MKNDHLPQSHELPASPKNYSATMDCICGAGVGYCWGTFLENVMSEHTKEPWIITGGERIKYVEARIGNGMLQEIATCMIVEHGNHDANARRIVACVNACAGIPTEKLEAGPLETLREILSAAELKKQRDELLAALKETKKALEIANFSQPSQITDTLWMTKSETLFDFIDATIAKATA